MHVDKCKSLHASSFDSSPFPTINCTYTSPPQTTLTNTACLFFFHTMVSSRPWRGHFWHFPTPFFFLQVRVLSNIRAVHSIAKLRANIRGGLHLETAMGVNVVSLKNRSCHDKFTDELNVSLFFLVFFPSSRPPISIQQPLPLHRIAAVCATLTMGEDACFKIIIIAISTHFYYKTGCSHQYHLPRNTTTHFISLVPHHFSSPPPHLVTYHSIISTNQTILCTQPKTKKKI